MSVVKFENPGEYFFYHRKNPDVSKRGKAKELRISESWLSKLVNGVGFASYNLACRMSNLMDIPVSSVMKKTEFKKGGFK